MVILFVGLLIVLPDDGSEVFRLGGVDDGFQGQFGRIDRPRTIKISKHYFYWHGSSLAPFKQAQASKDENTTTATYPSARHVGKTQDALEDIDARGPQQPDHQPEGDHGHNDVAEPLNKTAMRP